MAKQCVAYSQIQATNCNYIRFNDSVNTLVTNTFVFNLLPYGSAD